MSDVHTIVCTLHYIYSNCDACLMYTQIVCTLHYIFYRKSFKLKIRLLTEIEVAIIKFPNFANSIPHFLNIISKPIIFYLVSCNKEIFHVAHSTPPPPPPPHGSSIILNYIHYDLPQVFKLTVQGVRRGGGGCKLVLELLVLVVSINIRYQLHVCVYCYV